VSVPVFIAQEIGHTMMDRDVWMPTVVVGVQLTRPVQAVFAVAFSYALHREFLNEVADAGTLVFATTDAQTVHEERPLWLSVDIDGNALRQTINID
jgi:hypothetical protein